MIETLIAGWAALIIANIWIAEENDTLSVFWLGLSILFFLIDFVLA